MLVYGTWNDVKSPGIVNCRRNEGLIARGVPEHDDDEEVSIARQIRFEQWNDFVNNDATLQTLSKMMTSLLKSNETSNVKR